MTRLLAAMILLSPLSAQAGTPTTGDVLGLRVGTGVVLNFQGAAPGTPSFTFTNQCSPCERIVIVPPKGQGFPGFAKGAAFNMEAPLGTVIMIDGRRVR